MAHDLPYHKLTIDISRGKLTNSSKKKAWKKISQNIFVRVCYARNSLSKAIRF